MNTARLTRAFELAQEQYAEQGVSVDKALRTLRAVSLSLHCWQGDDVAGFERIGTLDGGIATTGNYPGRARTPEELRSDLALALRLIPGSHRVNLHALYADTRKPDTDRDSLGPEHFAGWIAWARERRLGLDFNPSYFSHPLAKDGLTLSHPDKAIRRFWIAHGIASRQIGAAFGRKLGTPSIVNLWIPDGFKDTPVDRFGPRERLRESLDEIYARPLPRALVRDAVESKLFGLGSESYVVGSHEFYMGYAMKKGLMLCLDFGHFHPTESIADKISSLLLFTNELLLHVSRGVRWDSDHVVTFSDELQAVAREVVVGNALDRVHLATDFFDASINRIAAWVIGARNVLKALLAALLTPTTPLQKAEQKRDFTARLALQEEYKNLPFGAVWDYYCLKSDVPVGDAWLAEVRRYEHDVLSQRG